MTGYDTAGAIQDIHASAHSEYGARPSFCIRYFTPSPAADLFNDDPLTESRGAWDGGAPSVGCISAPTQSRLGGSAAKGQADAQAFAAAMLAAYHAVRPLRLPSNGKLYCWLDQEYSTSLSSNYWNAWANYIAEYDFAGLGTYPLYPCLYCDPYSPYPNCPTIAKSRHADKSSAIWSSEPEARKADQGTPLESSPIPDGTYRLWQFGDQIASNFSANVDHDVGAPGFTTAHYCFHVSRR